MTTELNILVYTLLATAFMAFPYVLNRIAVRGLFGAMANPSSDHTPIHAWAERAKRAHVNAIENLVVFAPAVLALSFAELGNDATETACLIYLIARLVHYFVYMLGIPVVRTIAFFAGWGATVFLLMQAGGLL